MDERIIEVTGATFEDEVLKSDLPVLIDFWAEWCGPCRMIAPLVDELAQKYEGKLRVGKVNADTDGDILMNYGIRGIPTLILFKNGAEAERIVGFKPLNAWEPQIVQHLD